MGHRAPLLWATAAPASSDRLVVRSVLLMGFRGVLGVGVAMIAGLCSLDADAASTSRVRHHGDMLVQIEASPDDVHALGLDLWTHRADGSYVLTRLRPEDHAVLGASGLAYTVVDPNLGVTLDAEIDRLQGLPDPVPGGGLDPDFYADYRTYDAVQAQMAGLLAAYPERVSAVEVGTSLHGRAITGVRITNPGDPDRPIVIVQACQHAREWITVAASMYAAQRFAEADSGGLLDYLLDETQLVVIPIVNPDGYVYSWEVDRLWRKNRREDYGVDLNRNWMVGWGGPGASPFPDEGNYHGEGPFSEPESTAMRDFIDAEPGAIAFLDVHSFGQLLLYPWGFDYVVPSDEQLFADMTQDMSDAMFQPNDLWYQPLQSADFYPAAGNAIDWGYGVHGLYGVALELRPNFDSEEGFMLGPGHIVPTGEELLAGISSVMQSSLELGPGEPGDSGGPFEEGGGDQGVTSGGSDDGPGFTSGPADGGSFGGSEVGGSGEPPPGGTAGDGGPPGAGSSGGGGSETSGQSGLDGDQRGCACSARRGGNGGGAWGLAVLGLWWWRRRRPAAGA